MLTRLLLYAYSKSYTTTLTYDNEGRRTQIKYPDYYAGTAPNYYVQTGVRLQYLYDVMGRPSTLNVVDAQGVVQRTLASGTSYNAAGQLLGMSYLGASETRQYNARNQLTRLTMTGMDLEYVYSATQNDGRIDRMKNWTTGEDVNYQYDSLKRLISASTTGPEWGQSYTFDGFGNLLTKAVTKGSATTLNLTVDPLTNRVTNGGVTYSPSGEQLAGWATMWMAG
jgi:hypothetical protein